MRLRRGERTDVEVMGRILRACYDRMTYLPKLHTSDEDLWFIGEIVLPKQEVWIAEENGRVVGFAALSDDMLMHLYVDPDEQNAGIGSELFARAQERRPAGFTFWVFQKNEGARRFYERHDCRLVRTTDGSGNEEREPDALYEWRPD